MVLMASGGSDNVYTVLQCMGIKTLDTLSTFVTHPVPYSASYLYVLVMQDFSGCFQTRANP